MIENPRLNRYIDILLMVSLVQSGPVYIGNLHLSCVCRPTENIRKRLKRLGNDSSEEEVTYHLYSKPSYESVRQAVVVEILLHRFGSIKHLFHGRILDFASE